MASSRLCFAIRSDRQADPVLICSAPVPGELTILGFEDEANALVPVLFGLQTAHDRLMDRAVKERVELILCAFKAGTITPKQASTMLGIDASAVYELLSGEPE